VAHKNEYFSNGNYETWISRLENENAACCRLYLKEASARLKRLDYSNWFCSAYRKEYQRNLSTDHSSLLGERSCEIVEVNFAEITGDREKANERYYTPCTCCLSIFS